MESSANRLNAIFIILTLFFASCGTTATTKSENIISSIDMGEYHLSSIEDTINKYINDVSAGMPYRKTEKEELLNDYSSLRNQINEFYEFNIDVEAYILEIKKEKIVILVGKAAGATGLGVDYWWYKCFSEHNQEPVAEFISLAKSPYSIFWNKQKNCICHMEIAKDGPNDSIKELTVTIYTKGDVFKRFHLPIEKKR